MKTIIAGTRDTQMPVHKIFSAIKDCGWEVTWIVSGGGGNVDYAAKYVADVLHLPFTEFKADWSKGKKAGPLRNQMMADYSEALIAIWDGKSRGTLNMIKEARKRNLRLYVI